MFNSGKAEELKSKYAQQLKSGAQQDRIISELLDLVSELAAEVDMLRLKAEEADEKADAVTDNLEYINSNLQLIRDRIVGEIKVDTDEYTVHEADEHECGCGHSHEHEDENIYFDEEEQEEYITLQCCNCQELFFIDKKDDKQIVECPFCRKHVRVGDCLID